MKLGSSLVALSLMIAAPVAAQYTVNMRDADVRAFAQDAARVTGLTIVVDGRVNQKVSVVSGRSMSRSEYFEIFLSTLRANGLVAVPIRNGYRIQPVDGAASQPSRVGSRAASRNQFVTEIFRLRSIDAPGAIETLRPLVSPQGSITANRNANSLVVADFADNVAKIRQLIQRIDRNADTDSSRIVYLRNVGPREIATSLSALAAGGGEGQRGVTVSSIDSSNAVVLRGDSATVERFAAIARDLDARAAGATEIKVYWLEHADAEQLLPVLQQLVGQPVTQASEAPQFIRQQQGEGTGAGPSEPRPAATPAATPQSSGTGIIRSGPAVVTRYTGTNAIIVAANANAQRQLGEVIRQLDTRREQVLVEAIIVEIGDEAAKRLGVQFLLAGKNAPFLATNYSNAQPNIFPIAGAVANYRLGRQQTTSDDGTIITTTDSPLGQGVTDAAVQSILGATGGFGGGVVNIAKNTLFGAIVNAVKSDTSSNLLSAPSIMTLDNQEAKLLVGQEVPVTTGEQLSTNFDNAFRTVQRQNVGIQLDVKPQVNSSGSIKMFIRQEVSSVAGPVSARSNDLIINKREFKTVLTVDDGDVLAIGGLLDENERRTIEKIPLLGDIPVLGELFKSRSRSKAKTNLMVFIRPTLIRTREEAREVTAQRYGYIRNEQIRRNPDVEPSLDSLIRDYMGGIPPIPATAIPGDVAYPPEPLPAPQPTP
ncbi:type II secretion system secretin GspD [Sphingomonas sp. LY160]|uniref:type II secretion system secretin GspD n=1 Tax=Sphingomonas sp. LY160 TaxID=3095342 RepID=UPI002ADEB205|nr:type II secretion system secretin GspD [Sphingomonas sp. LY160]MEA1072870.1 type II secretion system secretin GspD [Sphingomonas sp. LY160]